MSLSSELTLTSAYPGGQPCRVVHRLNRTILLTERLWLSKQRQSRASACAVDAKMTELLAEQHCRPGPLLYPRVYRDREPAISMRGIS
jgi:hypothetical protein